MSLGADGTDFLLASAGDDKPLHISPTTGLWPDVVDVNLSEAMR